MAAQLKKMRAQRKMSQAVRAKKARISCGYLVASGPRNKIPRLALSSCLAKALGVPVTELLQ